MNRQASAEGSTWEPGRPEHQVRGEPDEFVRKAGKAENPKRATLSISFSLRGQEGLVIGKLPALQFLKQGHQLAHGKLGLLDAPHI